MDLLLTFAIVILVLAVLYWAVHRIAGAFGLPPQVLVIFDVLLVGVFIVWALSALGLLNRLR